MKRRLSCAPGQDIEVYKSVYLGYHAVCLDIGPGDGPLRLFSIRRFIFPNPKP